MSKTTNRAIMNRLESALMSLESATDLNISTEGIATLESGLCSSYKTHQTIETRFGHGIRDLLILENRKYNLLITPPDVEWLTGDLNRVELPIWMLSEKFFKFPVKKPDFLKKSGMVSVYMPDSFSGYAEDGTPQFGKKPSVQVDGEDFQYWIAWEVLPLSYGKNTRRKIGCKYFWMEDGFVHVGDEKETVMFQLDQPIPEEWADAYKGWKQQVDSFLEEVGRELVEKNDELILIEK